MTTTSLASAPVEVRQSLGEVLRVVDPGAGGGVVAADAELRPLGELLAHVVERGARREAQRMAA